MLQCDTWQWGSLTNKVFNFNNLKKQQSKTSVWKAIREVPHCWNEQCHSSFLCVLQCCFSMQNFPKCKSMSGGQQQIENRMAVWPACIRSVEPLTRSRQAAADSRMLVHPFHRRPGQDYYHEPSWTSGSHKKERNQLTSALRDQHTDDIWFHYISQDMP